MIFAWLTVPAIAGSRGVHAPSLPAVVQVDNALWRDSLRGPVELGSKCNQGRVVAIRTAFVDPGRSWQVHLLGSVLANPILDYEDLKKNTQGVRLTLVTSDCWCTRLVRLLSAG